MNRRCFEEYIAWFDISMNNLFVLNTLIPLQNLSQNKQSLLFRQTFWMFTDVICQSPSFKQLHNEIDVILKNYCLKETNNVFVLGVLEFS